MTLEESWGVHSVDCFASYYNKVGKFFSRFWNPGCSEVDFFVQNLEGENCLVVPPVSLIARAIHYLHVSKAIATIVLAPVVRKVDNAIHRINHYPADSVVCFANSYSLDSDLSAG